MFKLIGCVILPRSSALPQHQLEIGEGLLTEAGEERVGVIYTNLSELKSQSLFHRRPQEHLQTVKILW